MTDATAGSVPRGAALYLAIVQFLFVTTWTIYVIFLPGLLEQAGIPSRYAPWLLMIDQLVFMIMDGVMGVAADRAGRVLGRIGPLVVGVTTVSCVAFLLIPHATLLGTAAPAASLALVVVWAATSSALRAPPWVLLSKYAATPSLPWMNALVLTGLAMAGAIAPYLGVALKNLDARLPFALSSLVLLMATVGLVRAERQLAVQAATPTRPSMPVSKLLAGGWLFLIGCLLLAQGFQTHFSLNSAGQYLRFTQPQQLDYLMPVFWVGFNIAMFPGAALAKRFGRLSVIAIAAFVGAGGMLASSRAPSLDLLIAGQFIAGGAWGCVLMASFSAALELGRTGREGLAVGLLFATLAGATLIRMAITIGQYNKLPEYAPLVSWAPIMLWLVAGVLFIALAAARSRRTA